MILEKKFKQWKQCTDEFETFYLFILYESSGDFKTYSKLIGYDNYEDFANDYELLMKEQ